MKEKSLQILFGHWLKANWKQSAAFELKICKTNRFNLKCIAEHQLANLEVANNRLFFYKLPDLGLQNPFDCLTLFQVPAYVVIFFYKPRQTKKFCAIPIGHVIAYVGSGQKSITEKEAEELASLRGFIGTLC
jgi:hypothetical protein